MPALRSLARLLVLASVLGTTAAVGAPAPAAAVDNSGTAFVAAASEYRAEHGLGPVAFHAAVDRIAGERAAQLVAADRLGHDFDYLMRRFDEEGICWRGMGEIVAWNGSGEIANFMEQWHNSAPHRAILQGASYDVAGGRAAPGVDGKWYAAMIFVETCGGGGTAPAPSQTTSFTDVSDSIFRADIAWLLENEITAGCTTTTFCPKRSVTRDQMASFLARATGVPSTAADWFRDDNTSMHESDINRIASANITGGCTTTRYCPTSRITRGQMASFLARTLGLPAASRDWFRDDNGTMHESAINRLAEAGITGGCAAGRYCPDASVTREQMAGFLHRAFGD